MTGAGSGIGQATAERFVAEGASVALLDVRGDAVDEVAARLTQGGGDVVAYRADVGDEDSVAAAMASAASTLGGIDAVASCAGITFGGSTDSTSLDRWEAMVRVNLTGTFLVVKHALPHLLVAGTGAIVTVGSVASVVAAGRCTAYDASKGAVLQFTRGVAVEFANRGIRANCVCPGFVDTDLGANSQRLHKGSVLPDTAYEGPARQVPRPIERAASPAEIASVIAFLVSDDASFVTGIAMPVDGGYTAV